MLFLTALVVMAVTMAAATVVLVDYITNGF